MTTLLNDERRDAATEGGNENPRVSLLMPYCGICAKTKLFYWIQRKMFFINKKNMVHYIGPVSIRMRKWT